MRTIKFRGKRINRNGEWAYGDLRQLEDRCLILPTGADAYKAGIDADWVQKETIGQFTGLTDKNCKEIYEGDILAFVEDKNKSFPFVVLFMHGAFGYKYIRGVFYSFAGNPNFTFNPLNTDVDIEIIGNIHDNIELLTKNEQQ
jgi:uncharacterized phage protein (TIGR01671 family)